MKYILNWEFQFQVSLSPLPSFKIISCNVEAYLRLNQGEHDTDETD